MRRILAALLLTVAFFMTAVQAEARPVAAVKGVRTVTGIIDKVKGEKLVVTFTNKKGQQKHHKISVSPDTKVIVNGKSASLSQLKPGEAVTITLSHHHVLEIDATGK